MGGAEAALEKARSAYGRGEYRWVAEVVNHVVFADPGNVAARELQADALEQMGYQAEAGPWRNFYLTGAKELREGVVKLSAPNTVSPDSVRAMSLDLFFNYLGVRLNGPKASDTRLTLNLEFTDTGDRAVLELANGALNHLLGHAAEEADATVTLTRSALDRVIVGDVTLADEVSSGEITVEPDSAPLEKLVSLLDTFEFWFPIIEP
jgi:alkyl sulfatase BDS1-like metallo-beta-lactamase superfamily hydrolase